MTNNNINKDFKVLNEFFKTIGLIEDKPRRREWEVSQYNDATVFKRRMRFRGSSPVFLVKKDKVLVGDEKNLEELYNDLI